MNEVGRKVREWQDVNFDEPTMVEQLAVLTEEVGELARVIIKTHHNVRPASRGVLEEELCDVLLCVLSLADRGGVDIEAALERRLVRLMSLDFRADPEASRNNP